MNRRFAQVHVDPRDLHSANNIRLATITAITPKKRHEASLIKTSSDPTVAILEDVVDRGDDVFSRYKSTITILQNAIDEVKSMMSFTFKEPIFIRYSPIYIPPLFLRRRFNLVVVTSNELDGGTLKTSFLDEQNMHIFMDIFFSTITSTPILSDITGSVGDLNHSLISVIFQAAFTLQMCTIAMNIMAYCSAVVVPNDVFYEWYVARIGVLHFILVCHVAGFYLYLIAITAWPFLAYDDFISGIIGSGVSVLILGAFAVRGGILDYVGKELDPLLESCKSLHTSEKLKGKALEEVHLIGKTINQHLAQQQSLDDLDSMEQADDNVRMSAEMFLQTVELSEKYLENFTRENVETLADIMSLNDSDYLQLNVTIGDKLKIRRKVADLTEETTEAKPAKTASLISAVKSQISDNIPSKEMNKQPETDNKLKWGLFKGNQEKKVDGSQQSAVDLAP